MEDNICSVTGKRIYSTLSDAKNAILTLKTSTSYVWDGNQKRRLKHRQGKVRQKRTYLCDHCNSFHLTSWETEHKKNKK